MVQRKWCLHKEIGSLHVSINNNNNGLNLLSSSSSSSNKTSPSTTLTIAGLGGNSKSRENLSFAIKTCQCGRAVTLPVSPGWTHVHETKANQKETKRPKESAMTQSNQFQIGHLVQWFKLQFKNSQFEFSTTKIVFVLPEPYLMFWLLNRNTLKAILLSDLLSPKVTAQEGSLQSHIYKSHIFAFICIAWLDTFVPNACWVWAFKNCALCMPAVFLSRSSEMRHGNRRGGWVVRKSRLVLIWLAHHFQN